MDFKKVEIYVKPEILAFNEPSDNSKIRKQTDNRPTEYTPQKEINLQPLVESPDHEKDNSGSYSEYNFLRSLLEQGRNSVTCQKRYDSFTEKSNTCYSVSSANDTDWVSAIEVWDESTISAAVINHVNLKNNLIAGQMTKDENSCIEDPQNCLSTTFYDVSNDSGQAIDIFVPTKPDIHSSFFVTPKCNLKHETERSLYQFSVPDECDINCEMGSDIQMLETQDEFCSKVRQLGPSPSSSANYDGEFSSNGSAVGSVWNPDIEKSESKVDICTSPFLGSEDNSSTSGTNGRSWNASKVDSGIIDICTSTFPGSEDDSSTSRTNEQSWNALKVDSGIIDICTSAFSGSEDDSSTLGTNEQSWNASKVDSGIIDICTSTFPGSEDDSSTLGTNEQSWNASKVDSGIMDICTSPFSGLKNDSNTSGINTQSFNDTTISETSPESLSLVNCESSDLGAIKSRESNFFTPPSSCTKRLRNVRRSRQGSIISGASLVEEDCSKSSCNTEESNSGQVVDVSGSLQSNNPRTSRTKIKPLKCSVCEVRCKYPSQLKAHYRTHTGEKLYQCIFCHAKLSSSSSLKLHLSGHTGEKPFKCSFCEYRSAVRYYVKYHEKIHLQERSWKCFHCNKTFADRQKVRIHLRTHSSEKPFKCDSCNFRARTLHTLQCHVLTHTSDKPVPCTACKHTFRTAYALKRHFRLHTGENMIECTVCVKKFRTRSELKSHMMLHTGEKPFSCLYCDRRFQTKQYLIFHVMDHTGERPYSCPQCELVCKTSYQVKRHLQSIHNKDDSQ